MVEAKGFDPGDVLSCFDDEALEQSMMELEVARDAYLKAVGKAVQAMRDLAHRTGDDVLQELEDHEDEFVARLARQMLPSS